MDKSLWIVTNLACNLACIYCYQGDHAPSMSLISSLREAKLVRVMTDSMMERVVSFAKDWGGDGLSVVWYGGEPLIWAKGIRKWDPILRSRFVRYRSSITTNGLLLMRNREWIDEMKIGVAMSLDGPAWIHDRQRPRAGGLPSWDRIDPLSIIAWRPNMEIIWQLHPRFPVYPNDLDWMIDNGFRRVNFNLVWNPGLVWDLAAQDWLRTFMREVARACLAGRLMSNWMEKLRRAVMEPCRMSIPCGTGNNLMLAVTPEGWLYPSQEMAFTAFQAERAPGTPEYYRVGDVSRTPFIDQDAVARVSTIRVEQMTPPPEFDCMNCHAARMCLGACHCRMIGANGTDPSWRYGVPRGFCQAARAAISGLIEGAVVEGRALDLLRTGIKKERGDTNGLGRK